MGVRESCEGENEYERMLAKFNEINEYIANHINYQPTNKELVYIARWHFPELIRKCTHFNEELLIEQTNWQSIIANPVLLIKTSSVPPFTRDHIGLRRWFNNMKNTLTYIDQKRGFL